ncbi:sigma-70 family RNA polymerase sigma factor [uncultured Clostridium sp.]|uniref:sigma-70 family RNA polymerase sigma factor n=1 Tax=uncultured Clostridium sp. TaxID=59620 RepID=UPI00258C211B|nr:sigma-70 family RNA polymerase sigma factor [uncultured Clostridium sp.]MDU1348286.1 sigma-70 family RNA polymerase sigma factor [Clostridium argentinense]
MTSKSVTEINQKEVINIDTYKKTVQFMLNNYKNIKAEIKNMLIEIEDIKNSYRGIGAIKYSDMPKSNNISSSVEKEIEQKEKRIEYLSQLLTKKENQIKRIDNALETLSEEEYNLIKMCYFDKVKVKDAAIKLDVTEQTICRNKSIILNKIIPIIFIE